MLSKESKIRILENFYALDYIFFGKPVSEVTVCCPVLIEEYISVKGAILSTMVEMFKLVNHSPNTISEQLATKDILRMARKSAKIARENCEKLVSSEKGRTDVKLLVKESINSADSEVDIENIVQESIRDKAFNLAVDNLLIARTLVESGQIDSLNEWDGRLLEDAYKILRDNLVSSAKEILQNAE